jgi:glycosyltransferase involved in cell wall biosynthesis
MQQLVSIIIPVFNHAQTIERSFRSALEQRYRPFEVILVDDGSIDDLQSKISNLKLWAQTARVEFTMVRQENKGAPAARNRGFKESRGEYVIFWDADTLAKKDMLEKLIEQLSKHSEASFSYSQFRFGWKKIRSQKFDLAALKKCNYIDTTSLIRREDFCGFDESLKRFQDWDLWLTLAEKGKKGVFVPEVLFKKIVSGRKGMSLWLPSFLYRLPWQLQMQKDYKKAKAIICAKHHLS